jgi:hypothetical protein
VQFTILHCRSPEEGLNEECIESIRRLKAHCSGTIGHQGVGVMWRVFSDVVFGTPTLS